MSRKASDAAVSRLQSTVDHERSEQTKATALTHQLEQEKQGKHAEKERKQHQAAGLRRELDTLKRRREAATSSTALAIAGSHGTAPSASSSDDAAVVAAARGRQSPAAAPLHGAPSLTRARRAHSRPRRYPRVLLGVSGDACTSRLACELVTRMLEFASVRVVVTPEVEQFAPSLIDDLGETQVFGDDDLKFARACRNLQRLQQEGKVRSRKWLLSRMRKVR